jgi:hypothetical protein
MTRMHGLVRALAFVFVLGLAIESPGQDNNPFGAPVADKPLIDDTQEAPAAGDDPFAAPGESTVERKVKREAEQRTVKVDREAVLSGNVHSRPASSDARVREALSSPTRMEFTEMPLIDAVDYLKDHHGIEIQLDNRALEDAGVGSDTPVTRNLNGLPLSSSLRLLLEDYDLTYVVRDGVLMITTADKAENYLELKVYDITKEVAEDAQSAEVGETLALLRRSTLVNPQQGPAAPDNFTVLPFRNLLIIRASQHDHEALDKLFAEMKSKLAND